LVDFASLYPPNFVIFWVVMNQLMIDCSGRTVLITGAATGIGRATGLAFAAARASVVIGDVRRRKAVGRPKRNAACNVEESTLAAAFFRPSCAHDRPENGNPTEK